MIKQLTILASVSLLGALAFATPSSALTMKECSAKYKSAQPDVTLNSGEEPEKPTMTAPKGVSFPTAVAPKYAKETPGKGRMHTCVDAYHQNKDANTLNGLKWIQKGGGFYSLCNANLKS